MQTLKADPLKLESKDLPSVPWQLQYFGASKSCLGFAGLRKHEKKNPRIFLKTLPKATPLRRTIQCPDGIICISLIFKLDKRKP
jgi:hypothetical protein